MRSMSLQVYIGTKPAHLQSPSFWQTSFFVTKTISSEVQPFRAPREAAFINNCIHACVCMYMYIYPFLHCSADYTKVWKALEHFTILPSFSYSTFSPKSSKYFKSKTLPLLIGVTQGIRHQTRFTAAKGSFIMTLNGLWGGRKCGLKSTLLLL